MSRRIELELTSARPDGTWTWRAAGAREPRGVLAGELLPGGAKVGDVLRADADFDMEGITVIAVLARKGARKEPERLELIAPAANFEPVTQTLTAKRSAPRRDRRDGERDESRPRRDGDRRPSDRPPRSRRTPAEGDHRPDDQPERRDARPRREPRERPPRAERPPRPPVPEVPMRPKPKRLRPVRTHRNAALAELAPEQKAVAEQVLRGGVPAVRQALEEQNAKLRAEDKPEVPPAGVVALAEELLPRLRVAEWLDRAEGALNDLDELDLRDLRSVVVAGDDPVVARDETTRDMAARLKDGLANRQDKEHQDWLADIDAALGVGRSVRALRLSSRPPKAGVRFPPELAGRLGQATLASLTPDASSDRWVAVLEALAYSPVHATVVPAAAPSAPSDELRATVKRLAGLIPEIALLFGIEPPAPGSRMPRPARRPPPRKPDRPDRGKASGPRRPPADATGSAAPARAVVTESTPTTDSPTIERAPEPEPATEPEPAAESPAPAETTDVTAPVGTPEPAETSAAAESPAPADRTDMTAPVGTPEPAETIAAAESPSPADRTDMTRAPDVTDPTETVPAAEMTEPAGTPETGD
jgi:hypothetical protein